MVGCYRCNSGSIGFTKYVVPEEAQCTGASLNDPSTGSEQMANAI